MPRVLFGVTVAMTANAFLRDQMGLLVELGWEVHLACSPDDGTDSYERLQECPGLTLHPLPMLRDPHPLRDVKSLWDWYRLIGELAPDLVVASTPKAGLLGMLTSRARRVPARVYHVRGLRAEGLRGVMGAVSRLAERLSTAASTSVLVDSPSLLVAMRKGGLVKSHQGQVLGRGSCCGVDTDFFRPPSIDERKKARVMLGLSERDVVVGFVGRVASDKGVPELLASTSRAHHANPDVKLVIVGPLEDAEQLESILDEAKRADWVQAQGPTSDVRNSYWAFDLFCSPSHREGFPVASLEAQACGLPVITTDATGCIDAVDDGYTGRIVAVGDVATLSAVILNLAIEPDIRTAMGMAARQRVCRDFERATVNERFVSYLSRLVGAP